MQVDADERAGIRVWRARRRTRLCRLEIVLVLTLFRLLLWPFLIFESGRDVWQARLVAGARIAGTWLATGPARAVDRDEGYRSAAGRSRVRRRGLTRAGPSGGEKRLVGLDGET